MFPLLAGYFALMKSDKCDSKKRATTLAEDDIALFRRSVSDARPLRHSAAEPIPPRVPAKARFTRRDEKSALQESLDPEFDLLESNSGDSLQFRRPEVGRKTMRKLARGSFSVQAELDLHGMTVADARSALRDFVEYAIATGLTCVRIIHGKGLGSGLAGPVLKPRVDGWLRQWDPVLAFVSARPVDGGTGAVYVLLRKQ